MKRAYLLTVAVLLGPAASAQPAQTNGIVLGTNARPTPSTQTCVQVQIGKQSGSSYNCLNQELQQQAQAANPLTLPSFSATSPANAVGTFNRTGVAEQYGQNFGKSVIPYRPTVENFSNPLH